MSLKRRENETGSSLSIRKRWKLIAAVCLSLGIASSSGCTAMTGLNDLFRYNNEWNEYMMGNRANSLSMKAWHSNKHCFVDQKYIKDFKRGFRAGYLAVADGGDGCTPAFPPREYWNWRYQSAEGQARVAAWFAGFPHGAQAADQEGVGSWHQIQTSSGIQKQYADHQLMPNQYNGVYPVPKYDLNRSLLDPRANNAAPVEFFDSEVVAPQVLQQGDALQQGIGGAVKNALPNTATPLAPNQPLLSPLPDASGIINRP